MQQLNDKNIKIRFLEPDEIDLIVPMLAELNETIPLDILSFRAKEMMKENYKCVGIFDQLELIGMCGLWFMTRHYCGKSMEPDHVFIKREYRDHGLGNKLFEWLFEYASANKLEATELNTYVKNTRSHKFYYNLGYEILGFHFVKRFD